MRLVKIGLANVNTTVGALRSNVDRALALAKKMAAADVTLGIFQEQLIGGYPAEDLIQWQSFVEPQWKELKRFAEETSSLRTAFVIGLTVVHQGLRYNCAAVVASGKIWGIVPKHKLPSYSVFYEGRTFSRGVPWQQDQCYGVPFGDFIFRFDFGLVAAEICEDMWSSEGPIRRRTYSGAELVANISASPFRVGVTEARRELVSTRAADHQCTLAYSNAVGCNDGLIFDGGGLIYQNGKPVLEAPRFAEGFTAAVVDLDRTSRLRSENTTWRSDCENFLSTDKRCPVVEIPPTTFGSSRRNLTYPVPPNRSFFLPAVRQQRTAREELCEDILDALAMGIGDYYEKTKAFRGIGIALSGGRDSTLTLLIAYRYAQRANPGNPGALIHAFYMPSRFSSPETRNAAETICDELKVPLTTVSIDDAFEREIASLKQMLGDSKEVPQIALQNIQSRLRAQRMWNWSNSSSGLFLQTGNMSEKAVGYTTIGGDLMGALAVIANVPKTVVIFLLDYLYDKHHYQGIKSVMSRPAGPELAPNQVGEEELMPYPVLDACFYLFAGEKLKPDEVHQALCAMFPETEPSQLRANVDKFIRLFVNSIFKWVQAPLSLHIGNLDLERERALQLPVVTKTDWAQDG